MNITKTHIWMIFLFALLLRLISLATYPLMDTTEARYGEMARLMVETGNWLTPQFDYGIPFWGKPPLFTWMSAYGITLFGLNEFAVRAPHWLAGIATIGIIAFMTYRANYNALIAATVLATCGIFSIAAGAVMTDMALTLSITIAMVGFYYCWLNKDENSKRWGYVSFFGLACGLLAKGPLAIVIMSIAVLPWLIIQHGFLGALKALWQRFPIISGTLLMLAIALPWYIMAEAATPGFIDYFIVGENIKRFLVSGWEGDLYGNAHQEPYGTIWLFWLQSAAPWSIVLPFLAWRRRVTIKQSNANNEGLFSFLICWLLSPMILFSMAGNILPAYVLPGIPALGLLIAMLINKHDLRWLSGTATIVPILLMIAIVVLNMGKADKRSDRIIYSHILDDAPVFYTHKRPFSGQFYSRGKAKKLDDIHLLNKYKKYYLIGETQEVEALIHSQKLSCTNDFIAESKRALYSCYRE